MPSMPKANEAKFLISIADNPSSMFTVTKFSGNDAVSEPFSFDIEFQLSESALTSGKKKPELTREGVLGKPCRLELVRDGTGEINGYGGVVMSFKKMHRSKPVYAVRLSPWIQLLSLNVNNRVFQKMSVVDIVQKVVADAMLDTRCNFKYKCGGYKYPKIDFCVQYRESDLNFISRLMEQNGIWYYFTDDGGVVITDIFANFSNTALNIPFVDKFGFVEDSKRREDAKNTVEPKEAADDGMVNDGNENNGGKPLAPFDEYLYAGKFGESVYELTSVSAVIPKSVRLRNQNYRTPETPPEGSAKGADAVGAWGSIYEYGGTFKNDEEGKRFAALYMTRLIVENSLTVGESRCTAFRAGQIVGIDGIGKFLLLSVEHHGGEEKRSGGPVYTYDNIFHCVDPAKKTYAPPLRAETPTAIGLITAPVDALGDDLPNIDEMGRYRVKLPFDLSDTPKYGATKDIRLSQISGGDGYGVHFPSKKNSEMILGYVDGNPDKPIGLGLLPDANARSVSNSVNRTESIIRTWGGNELIMDDEKEKSKITLRTAAGHELAMDDTKNSAKVSMRTTAGHKLVMNDEPNKTKITLYTVGGNELTMDDNLLGKTVTLSTAKVDVKTDALNAMTLIPSTKDALSDILKKIPTGQPDLSDIKTVVNKYALEKSELKLDNKELSATLRAWGQKIVLKENAAAAEHGINLSTSAAFTIDMNDTKREIAVKTPSGNSIVLNDPQNNIVVSNKPKAAQPVKETTDGKNSVDGENRPQEAKKTPNKTKTEAQETVNGIIIETDGGKIVITTSGNDGKITVKTNGNDGTIEIDNEKDTITLHNAEGKNEITLNGKNKSISMNSPGNIDIHADGDICISGKGKTVLGAKKNVFVNASGKTSVGGKSEVKVKGGTIKLN